MLFKNYEYFLAIADTRSLTKAADRLYISQPSLSKYLSRLEQNLGARLFDRACSPIALTRAGEAYYDYVRQAVELERELRDALTTIQEQEEERICLGIGNWRGMVMLPEFLPIFSRRHPAVDVQVLEGNSDFLENAILKGHVDFCVMSLPTDLSHFNCELIVTEKVLLVGNNEHPLVKKTNANSSLAEGYRSIDIGELQKEMFFMTRMGQNFARVIRDFFKKQDFHPDHVREINNLTTAYSMVVQGWGFAFIPEIGVRQISAGDNVSCFTLGNPSLKFPIAAVYKKNNALPQYVRLFIEMLKEEYAQPRKQL